jgi:hypothetical protein
MSQFTFPPVTISSVGVDYEKANAATALPSTLAIIGGWTGTAITALKTAADGALQIDVESGHGLATEAKQDTIEATLTAIETDADTIAGAVTGTEMQVDIVASLPAGSNNIGDVDVLSVIPGVGATNLGKAIQSPQGTTDTGVPALVVRNDTLADLAGSDHDYAPLQVNASGALYVEVKTSGLPSGAATEAKQDTIETTLTAIETDADTIAGAVSGTEMQVDVITSALPSGAATSALQTTANGILTTIDADTGSIAGAISGTEMQVDVVASLPAGSNNIGDVDIASMPADSKNYVWKEGLDSTIGGISNGILDCSTTNIPSGTQLIVATLSNDVYEIQTVEDIGEFIGIYAGSNLKAILPLGGGSVKINLPSTTVVKLASFSGTAISSGNIAINFLG